MSGDQGDSRRERGRSDGERGRSGGERSPSGRSDRANSGRADPDRRGGGRDGRQAAAEPGDRGQAQPNRSPGANRQPNGANASLTDELPLVSGAIRGIGAYIAGYVLIGVYFFVEGMNDTDPSGQVSPVRLGEFPEGGELLVKFVGWMFYNAHYVSIDVGGETVSLLSILGSNLAVPALVYHLTPAVLLLAAGWSVAKGALTPRSTPEDGAKYGATVAVGYLVLVFAGASYFSMAGGQPAMGSAVLLAGIGYPVVCGGLGGYLAAR